MMKKWGHTLLATLLLSSFAGAQGNVVAKSRLKNLLVTTFVGGGHAHPFRFTCGNWAKNELSRKYGWTVDVAADNAAFNSLVNLQKYQVIWFNGVSRFDLAFTATQQNNIRAWFESGKVGVVGNHGTTETYRGWAWADTNLLGGTYLALASPTNATLKRDAQGDSVFLYDSLSKKYPFMQGYQNVVIYDEVFGWDKNPRGQPGVKVVAVADENTYTGGGKMGGDHPLLWAREHKTGSRVFMSGTGHMDNFADYVNEAFVRAQFERALLWAGNYDLTVVPIRFQNPIGNGWIRTENRKINLSISSQGKHIVKIADLKGRVVYSHQGQGKAQYSIEADWKEGVYFAEVKTPRATESRSFILH